MHHYAVCMGQGSSCCFLHRAPGHPCCFVPGTSEAECQRFGSRWPRSLNHQPSTLRVSCLTASKPGRWDRSGTKYLPRQHLPGQPPCRMPKNQPHLPDTGIHCCISKADPRSPTASCRRRPCAGVGRFQVPLFPRGSLLLWGADEP